MVSMLIFWGKNDLKLLRMQPNYLFYPILYFKIRKIFVTLIKSDLDFGYQAFW